MAKYTLQQLLEAMKQNGFTKCEEAYFISLDSLEIVDDEELRELNISNIREACAVGTVAANLDIIPVSVQVENFINRYLFPFSGHESVSQMNDDTDLTIPQIADKLLRRAKTRAVLTYEFDSRRSYYG